MPALTRINGVLIQLVEIPGLIEGANEDRGGGRALLGVLRGADAILYCQDASASLSALLEVRAEVVAAGIELPALLAATKLDEAGEGAPASGCRPQYPISRCSASRSWTMRAWRCSSSSSGVSPA